MLVLARSGERGSLRGLSPGQARLALLLSHHFVLSGCAADKVAECLAHINDIHSPPPRRLSFLVTNSNQLSHGKLLKLLVLCLQLILSIVN